MATYAVTLITNASTVVEVTVPDDVTDPTTIAELAIEENRGPNLCHQCSGGGRSNGQELTIGDDWEPVMFDGTPSITRTDT